ncbi:glycosyl transferase family 2 [Candidatus Magnetomorum sp. HK-1]|nr:glycosyl transferase family 2 [Candidatus Magnetomorum sp. HK-1]
MTFNTNTKKLLSVVIPTYNRHEKIKNCLNSLNYQRMDRNKWEVIVVDDGSEQCVRTFLNDLSVNYTLRFVYQKNSGPAMARNRGATLSEGQFISFLDDDCEPHDTWLENLERILKPGELIGGKIVNKLKKNIFAETSQLLISFLYEVFHDTHLLFFTSNFTIDKKSFFEIGGFNTDFRYSAGEDREFSIRCNKMGCQLTYAPNLVVFHTHDLRFNTYIKQHFYYGRSANLFRKIMKKLNVNLVMDHPRFYFKLIFYPIKYKKKYSSEKKMILIMLLIISQVSYITGYFYSCLFFSKKLRA